MKSEKRNYIIGIHNSDGEASDMHRVYGTEYQVKRHLAKLIKEAISSEDKDVFEWANSKVDDIAVGPNYCLGEGSLYGCVQFTDYHIDYTAVPEEEAEILK